MKSFIKTERDTEASNIIKLLCFQLLDKVVTFLYQHVQGLQGKGEDMKLNKHKARNYIRSMVYLEMWPRVVNEYTNKWSKNTDHANKGARWEGSNRFHCEDEVVLHLESN